MANFEVRVEKASYTLVAIAAGLSAIACGLWGAIIFFTQVTFWLRNDRWRSTRLATP